MRKRVPKCGFAKFSGLLVGLVTCAVRWQSGGESRKNGDEWFLIIKLNLNQNMSTIIVKIIGHHITALKAHLSQANNAKMMWSITLKISLKIIITTKLGSEEIMKFFVCVTMKNRIFIKSSRLNGIKLQNLETDPITTRFMNLWSRQWQWWKKLWRWKEESDELTFWPTIISWELAHLSQWESIITFGLSCFDASNQSS